MTPSLVFHIFSLMPLQANLVLPNLEPFLQYSPKLGQLTQQLQLPRCASMHPTPLLWGGHLDPPSLSMRHVCDVLRCTLLHCQKIATPGTVAAAFSSY